MDRIIKNYPAFLAFQSCGHMIEEACRNGRLSLVNHHIRIERDCSNQWIYHAVVGGYLDLVKGLDQYRRKHWQKALDERIEQGNIGVIDWLYTSRSGLIRSLVNIAVVNEQWDIVEYFCKVGKANKQSPG